MGKPPFRSDSCRMWMMTNNVFGIIRPIRRASYSTTLSGCVIAQRRDGIWTTLDTYSEQIKRFYLFYGCFFPDHPYLLESSFELSDSLKTNGYVSKPIAGRCGFNISLFDGEDALMEETAGRFSHQDQIFQALWKLPDIEGYASQVCTFSVAGHYAGSCLRVDPTLGHHQRQRLNDPYALLIIATCLIGM